MPPPDIIWTVDAVYTSSEEESEGEKAARAEAEVSTVRTVSVLGLWRPTLP